MPAGLVIRELDVEDAAQAAALELSVFPGEAWSERMLAEELASPWTSYLGVFDQQRLVAYGGVKGDQDGDLMTIGVLPGYRSQGVGRRLLRELLGRAGQMGIGKLFLEVRASNDAARSMYRSQGFEELAVVPSYYRNPDEDAVTMRLNLTPAQ